jgi:hypothetical protein
MGVTIRDAMTDPALFGGIFGGDSFAAWRALLAGFHGLPLDADDLAAFQTLTGRQNAPESGFSELWLVVGRRGGKSHSSALLAVYEALFRDHAARLSPGEVATVLVMAADRAQARSAMRFTRGLIESNPMLARMVTRETETTIEFDNRAAIEIGTASFRSVRGYTLAAVICDEIAFWHSDGANPDKEIIQALRPALATLNGKLVALSSPYAKRGMLWDTYRRSYGDDADSRVLVAQAPTLTMNPTLEPAVVDRAMIDDPEAARAEYLAEFRSDIAGFLDEALLRDCVRPRPRELPRADGVEYFAFVDPSGGGADGFSLAIGHLQGNHAVIDLCRERHGSPAASAAEFAAVLKSYGVYRVTGDRYAGQWPRDEFAKHDITYTTSELDRSGLYLEFLARLHSGQVELPPDEKLLRQFIALERRTGRAGKDTIDHPPNAHDDLANAAAGVVALLKKERARGCTRHLAGLV